MLYFNTGAPYALLSANLSRRAFCFSEADLARDLKRQGIFFTIYMSLYCCCMMLEEDAKRRCGGFCYVKDDMESLGLS